MHPIVWCADGSCAALTKSGIAAVAATLVWLGAFALPAPSASAQGGGGGGDGAVRNGPILFTAGGRGLWRVNPDGTGLRRISKRRVWNLDAHPSGRKIAFAHNGLFTMRMNGRGVRDLLKGRVRAQVNGAYSPTWAPSGKKLAFAGNKDGRLYAIRGDGSRLRLVLPRHRNIGFNSQPRWSPRGGEIAFLDWEDRGSLKAVNLRTGRVRTIYRTYDPQTGESADAGTPEGFDFSPDGRRIIMYLPYENWMINSDGSGLRQVSEGYYGGLEFPTFSPDGRQIAAHDENEIWVIDGRGGTLSGQGGFKRMLTGGFRGSAITPEWAPAPR